MRKPKSHYMSDRVQIQSTLLLYPDRWNLYFKFKEDTLSRLTSEAPAADPLTYRHSFARLKASCSRGKFGSHTDASLSQQRRGAAPFPSGCNIYIL